MSTISANAHSTIMDPAANVDQVRAGARLDRLPIGRFHYKILFLIGSGLFLDSVDLSLSGGVLAVLLKGNWSSMALNAAFVSATFIGMLIGALASGISSDRYGRKFSFQLNLLVFGIGSLLAAFSPNMQWLIFWRFIIGIGLGAEVVIGYSTMSELMPASSRGRWVALTFTITNCGVLCASLLGLWLIPRIGWRSLFAIVGICAVAFWAARKSMPESPRWLESKGRYEEADAILATIETNYPDLAELPSARSTSPILSQPGSFAAIFSAGVRSRTFLAVVFNTTLGFCLYGLVGWMPTFFIRDGFDVASTLYFTTVMSIGAPVGGVIAYCLADRYGRRPFMFYGSLVSAVLALIYPHVGNSQLLTVVGFCLVTSLYFWIAAGMTMVPELFPTEYRFRGVGFCSTVGRVSTAFGQYAVVQLFSWGGVTAVVGLAAALLCLQANLFYFFAVETSCKSLEDATFPRF